jgi:mono/diheme cytochrome c family protein
MVGPNLDDLMPSKEQVEEQVRSGGGGMPSFAEQLSDQQIEAVAEYVSSSAGS